MDKLSDLSSKFYTTIPHNFGRQKMRNFIINHMDTLKIKLELVSNLIDIKAGHEIKEKAHRKSKKEKI